MRNFNAFILLVWHVTLGQKFVYWLIDRCYIIFYCSDDKIYRQFSQYKKRKALFIETKNQTS